MADKEQGRSEKSPLIKAGRDQAMDVLRQWLLHSHLPTRSLVFRKEQWTACLAVCETGCALMHEGTCAHLHEGRCACTLVS